MSLSTPQLAAMAATIGLGAFLYIKGKELMSPTNDPNMPLDGLDPNWPGGKPVGIDSPVNVHDVVPSCEIWDPTIQLFIRTHDPSWSESKERCFTNAVGTSPSTAPQKFLRYVDEEGKLWFNVENPLQTDPNEFGTCYFRDSKTSKLYSFPGFAPVNGSDRLCFAAGIKVEDAGQIFRNKQTGHVSYNPAIDADGIAKLISDNPDFDWARPGDIPDAVSLPQGSYCEELRTLNFAGSDPSKYRSVWVHSNASSAFDADVNACTAKNYRFIDPKTNQIVYRNPETGSLISRALDNQL